MDKDLMNTLGISGITELGDINELENAPLPSEPPPPKPSMSKIVGTNDLDDILGLTDKSDSELKKEEGSFKEIKFSKDEPFGPNNQKKLTEKKEKTKEKIEEKKENNDNSLDFLETSGIISDVKSENANTEKTEPIVEPKTDAKNIIAEPVTDTDADSKNTIPPKSPTDSFSEYIQSTIEELNKTIESASAEEKTSLGLKLSFYIKLSSHYARIKNVLISIDYNTYYEEIKQYTVNIDQNFYTPADLNMAIQKIYSYKDRVSYLYRMALRDFTPRHRMYDLFEKMAIAFVDGKSSDIRKAEAADLLSVMHADLTKAEVFFKVISNVYENLSSAFDTVSRQITIFQEQNKEISRGALPFIPQTEMSDVHNVTSELQKNYNKTGEQIRELRSRPTRKLGYKNWDEIEK